MRYRLVRIAPARTILVLAFVSGVTSAAIAADTPDEKPAAAPPPPMSQALRSSFRQLAIVPGPSPYVQGVEGTYDKDTLGFIGGVDAGTRAATVETEVGGANVRFPIPVLMWPARLIGGIAGKTQKEIQDFRDALTDDLKSDTSQPLSNENLALNVYQGIRKLPAVNARLFAADAELPDSTDAMLHVNITALGIDVQGRDAVITTIAEGELIRRSDEKALYKTTVYYSDRDTLARWTGSDNALWHSYSNFARHYAGREIAAQVFERVPFEHEIQPVGSQSVKLSRRNAWQATSKTLAPTLAWEVSVPAGNGLGDEGADVLANELLYDLEIYDQQRLVYAEKLLTDTRHVVTFGLEPCKSYRWTVRPAFRVGESIHYGDWMQAPPAAETPEPFLVGAAGVDGRAASVAPAMLQDFASLEVKCGSK